MVYPTLSYRLVEAPWPLREHPVVPQAMVRRHLHGQLTPVRSVRPASSGSSLDHIPRVYITVFPRPLGLF